MTGPFDASQVELFTSPEPCLWEKGKLFRDHKYVVSQDFVDADGEAHEVGEMWVLVGCSFSHYDGVANLIVDREPGRRGLWRIPLAEADPQQLRVILNIGKFMRVVGGA